MMCLRTSRLKIGRPADAEGRVRAGAGILIGRFSGPREGVACAGWQSRGQGEKDISACGEKISPSPWSSPRGEEKPSADSGFAIDRVRWLVERVRRLDCRSNEKRPHAIPPPGGEGQDEGELPAPKAVILSSVPGSFHRGGAEMRRDCGMGASARERVGVSGDGGRGDSNLRGLAAWRDENGIFGASQGESNLVQAEIFFGALGSGAQTATGTGGYAGLGGLVPNIYAGTSRRDVRIAERSVRRRNLPVSRVDPASTNSARWTRAGALRRNAIYLQRVGR
jgi:hypothetical protein